MNKVKCLLGSALVAISGLPVFAQEGGNASFDTTSAEDFMKKASKTITDYWDAIDDYVYSIIGVAVVVALVWVGWKLFRKGTAKVG